jgi:hypothetical protein
MMKLSVFGVALVVLSACASPSPDDGEQYFNSINPQVGSAALLPPEQVPPEQVPVAVGSGGLSIADADVGVTSVAPEFPENSVGISDSQSFEATTARMSIEADVARTAALKARYQVIEPTPLPERPMTVNLASYALTRQNAVGEPVYSRKSGLFGALNGCRRYKNSDAAQMAFLRAGGPEKDRRNLDPDGDGFACDWTPKKYRTLLQ